MPKFFRGTTAWEAVAILWSLRHGSRQERQAGSLPSGATRGAGNRDAKFGSVPGREGAAGEEDFGGPFAEVDGKSDAVAVVAGEDYHLVAARMSAEDGEHFFREENRPAPAVRDADGGKGRVQMANAVF